MFGCVLEGGGRHYQAPFGATWGLRGVHIRGGTDFHEKLVYRRNQWCVGKPVRCDSHFHPVIGGWIRPGGGRWRHYQTSIGTIWDMDGEILEVKPISMRSWYVIRTNGALESSSAAELISIGF